MSRPSWHTALAAAGAASLLTAGLLIGQLRRSEQALRTEVRRAAEDSEQTIERGVARGIQSGARASADELLSLEFLSEKIAQQTRGLTEGDGARAAAQLAGEALRGADRTATVVAQLAQRLGRRVPEVRGLLEGLLRPAPDGAEAEPSPAQRAEAEHVLARLRALADGGAEEVPELERLLAALRRLAGDAPPAPAGGRDR